MKTNDGQGRAIKPENVFELGPEYGDVYIANCKLMGVEPQPEEPTEEESVRDVSRMEPSYMGGDGRHDQSIMVGSIAPGSHGMGKRETSPPARETSYDDHNRKSRTSSASE